MSDMEIHDINRVIGARIRQVRKWHKMSQSEMGEIAGVAFQQIQKYERGVNRISASRLYKIAESLRLPIGSFFPKKIEEEGQASEAAQAIETAFTSSEAIECAKALADIQDRDLKWKLIDLMRSIAACYQEQEDANR